MRFGLMCILLLSFYGKNRSEVFMANKDTKDYERKFDFMEPGLIE